mgnify:CR=1 FL=1
MRSAQARGLEYRITTRECKSLHSRSTNNISAVAFTPFLIRKATIAGDRRINANRVFEKGKHTGRATGVSKSVR